MGVSDFVEREGSRDDGTQRSVRDAVADKALHQCELHVVAHSSSQRNATNCKVAGKDVERRNHGCIGRERAVQRQRAAVRGRFRKLREALASDPIEHEFGAAATGQTPDFRRHILRLRRQDGGGTKPAQHLRLNCAERERDRPRTQKVGDLDCRETDTAGRGGKQHYLPFLQAADRDQATPRRAKRGPDGGRLDEIELVGNLDSERAGAIDISP